MSQPTSTYSDCPPEVRECMVGELGTWPLAEMLLWLHQTERSAILRVGVGKEAAMLFVSAGTLRRVEWGELKGESALFELLACSEGRFNLMLREPPDAHANVQRSVPQILLQCAMAFDERVGSAVRSSN